MSSPPSKASPTSLNTRARSSSERTSHSVTSGEPTDSASSRTFFSIRSPWYVNASFAPPSASRLAIAQAIDRLFATPNTKPRLPSKAPTRAESTISDFSATLSPLRRPFVLIVFAAAPVLAQATAPTARLTPIRLPHMGERVLPRVRPGVIRIPAGHAPGRVTVIADPKLAPLALAYGRGL